MPLIMKSYMKKVTGGILFDIDNTLVEHGKEATEQAKRLFSRLKKKLDMSAV